MKAICQRVVKTVAVEETSTRLTFAVPSGTYTSDSITIDGQHLFKPGSTVLIVVESGPES